MKEIIRKARQYALSEIEKYGSPKLEHFELSYEKGQKLAKTLGVNQEIVALGTILMDLKIGECISEGKIQEHIARSSQASQKFLDQFALEKEIYDNIVACIESHHGTSKYICKEAEVCANADCYRFLNSRGIFSAVILFGRRNASTDNTLLEVEKKMEEKYKIISLEICKKELEPYYHEFKKLIIEAKKT